MDLNDKLDKLERRISALVRLKPPGWQESCKRITRVITALIDDQRKEGMES